MIASFVVAFGGALAALLKVFLVIAAAGVLVRRGVLSDSHITGLTQATVVLFLPCLIYAKITETLDPAATPLWWLLPLAGIAMPAIGLGLALLVCGGAVAARREALAVASMQNAGYLVLPVGFALVPDQFDTFALYTFLFILGFNPVLWSVGRVLISGRSGRGWRGLVTPPFAACLIAVAAALSGADRLLPGPVRSAVELIGQAAVPVATVVLGAVLGSVRVRWRPYVGDMTRVLVVKYGLLPAVTAGALWLVGSGTVDPLLARFLVLEAAAAPASALVLQVRAYGGDEHKVGSLMLVAYAVCAIALPLWLAIWDVIAG